MKVEQILWDGDNNKWNGTPSPELKETVNLVLLFGDRLIFEQSEFLAGVRQFYPNALYVGCTGAGEIFGTKIRDNVLVITAIQFERTQIKGIKLDISEKNKSYEVGAEIVKRLKANHDNLLHIFVLAEGLNINGSQLVLGLRSEALKNATITGGLAGDGTHFEKTLVYFEDTVYTNSVIAVGFYGDKLKIGHGSVGGWDTYGLSRMVTKSESNILYELDNKPALEIYEAYLGELAKELPASAMLFPLSLRKTKDDNVTLVRTVLGIDRGNRSMTFAGDLPKGSYVQFMKANFNRLVEGAESAATESLEATNTVPELAILVSCIGRKLVLKQRLEEETEAVQEVLGNQPVIAGFYSYGEISPFSQQATECELHNQTMTITTFKEEL